MSIRLKFRVVSLCIVVIMVAVVLVGYWVASVEITRKVHNNLNLVADLELQRVNEVLDRNFERLETVSARRLLQENLVRFTEDAVEDAAIAGHGGPVDLEEGGVEAFADAGIPFESILTRSDIAQ